jgi:hypothetical protein
MLHPLVPARCLVPWLLLSCGPPKEDVREKAREVQRLGQTASACWDALRWKEYQAASSCLETSSDQLAFLESWGGPEASYVTGYEILRVEVSDRLSNHEGPRLHDGSVILRVERIRSKDQVVESRTFSQQWYRTALGWYAERDSEEGF